MTDDINQDIDALISELNASSGTTRAGEGVLRVESLLTEVIARQGSDLLLVAGSAPGVRVNGVIARLEAPVLDGADIEEAVVPLLPPHARKQFQQTGIAVRSHDRTR
jgi:Tfp pilus assembly pilus retraction ATPase PilT